MSVKTIFKVLIGTIFVIIVGSLCMELFNINVASYELRSLCNISASQAAELFTQETYKQETSGSTSTKMNSVKASDGTVFATGDFYNSKTSASTIWTEIYVNEKTDGVANFKQVLELTKGKSIELQSKNSDTGKTFKTTYTLKTISVSSGNYNKYIIGTSKNQIKDAFTEVAELYAGLYGSSDITNANSSISSVKSTYANFVSGKYNEVFKKRSFINAANKMKSQYYTPVNIGFAYFSPTVTNKMFRWNLATILSGGSSDSIQKDESGNYYVIYKGFRCYVQQAYISNVNYYIYDLSNMSTSSSEYKQLKAQTGMDISAIKKLTTSSENNYLIVAGIIYSMPVAYQGVTPLKSIINFKWNSEVSSVKTVNGYNNNTSTTGNIISTNTDNTGSYNTAKVNLTNNTASQAGATGEIYYVLTR
jgi:hypothetical protein